MFERRKNRLSKPYLWLIKFIGVIVPRRLRADWRQEWEAELRYLEQMLAECPVISRDKLKSAIRIPQSKWRLLCEE
jgi:hypothetical protein